MYVAYYYKRLVKTIAKPKNSGCEETCLAMYQTTVNFNVMTYVHKMFFMTPTIYGQGQQQKNICYSNT